MRARRGRRLDLDDIGRDDAARIIAGLFIVGLLTIPVNLLSDSGYRTESYVLGGIGFIAIVLVGFLTRKTRAPT